MLVVALTGGIGSGKTTVGNLFASLGAKVIDSDQIAREILDRGSEGFDMVVATFGDGVLKNGEVDRKTLGEIVFNDSSKRKTLESITHPLIRKRFSELIANMPTDSIVINQIPLLFESKGAYKFDYVITVSTPEPLRIERLKKRGISQSEIHKRLEAQATDLERESIADSVISNDASEERLYSQVRSIWNKLNILNSNKP
jgi:dephospho-CoA kinase